MKAKLIPYDVDELSLLAYLDLGTQSIPALTGEALPRGLRVALHRGRQVIYRRFEPGQDGER